VRELGLPFSEVEWVEVSGETAVFVGGSPRRPRAVIRLHVQGDWEALTTPGGAPLDETLVSVGRSVEFPTSGDRTAHGIFYPPHLPGFAGMAGELPPLVVTSHGGPTAAASTVRSLAIQLFTTRGIAVLDVDYGGSTGYGRAYRKRLEGAWGIVDVDDCEAGARWLAEQGLVDRDRLAIRGGSASGYTTLAALAFRETFRAGICHFGIGDLETFVSETHKFESRYIDTLIGPYPEQAERYRERSPLRHLDGFNAPALITQGIEDKVVPVEQGRQIVETLRAKGLPVASIFFEGEDHGYRQAPHIIRAFEAELSFLGQVFGFRLADPIEPIEVEGLAARA
jgi:dipeptidyl aminopeptidase/acylaminoacyl peptidase